MDILLPLCLAFIMFSLGVSLQPIDFRRVFANPRAIAIGLGIQILGLPLLALLLLSLSGIGGEMAVGVMILASTPGGVSAGLLTLLAGGETALSVSLTAITSLGVLFTLPLTVGIALAHFAGSDTAVHMPAMRTGVGVFLITVLPVCLGMFFRQRRQDLAGRLEKPLARLSTVLFIFIVLATFVAQREVVLGNLPGLGPLLVGLNLLTMSLGFVAGGAGGLPRRQQLALAMECGLHNAALGIFVASLLQVPALAAPSVVYAFLMNFSAFGLVFLARRQGTATDASPA